MKLFQTGRHHPHDYSQPILRLKDITVEYDSGIALDKLNFELHASDIVGVIGPNGAGKSTLFKVIAGVIQPNSGKVEIYGSQPSGHICIGYVPQRSQVDMQFPVNVSEVVMMGRVGKIGFGNRPGKQDWEIVHHALDVVNLSDMEKRQISQLSGGQQQRVFIAQSLAQEAELMLMDEPLTGLDITSQNDIFNVIEKLKSRGVTMMISIHDLKIAASHFPKLMLINHNVKSFGSPQEVCTSQTLLDAYGGQLHFVTDRIDTVTFNQGGHTPELDQ